MFLLLLLLTVNDVVLDEKSEDIIKVKVGSSLMVRLPVDKLSWQVSEINPNLRQVGGWEIKDKIANLRLKAVNVGSAVLQLDYRDLNNDKKPEKYLRVLVIIYDD